VDLYATTPTKNDKTGEIPGFIFHHTAYPQIDNIVSAQTISWNDSEVRGVGTAPDWDGDEEIDYELGYVTASMISIRKTDEVYCHGTPHPNSYGPGIETMILFPTLHPLTPTDHFGPGDAWQDPFDDDVWKLVKAEGWSNGGSEDQEENQISSAAEDPTRWQFTPTGLTIVFQSGDGGCYACAPSPVTIPWPELKPYMSPLAVVP
jgi:hypothetical protein